MVVMTTTQYICIIVCSISAGYIMKIARDIINK